MNTNNNKHCCICLESFEHKSHYIFNFICQVCNEGTICNKCLCKLERQGDEYVKKCPTCREVNWKYQFNVILHYYLYDEVQMNGGFECQRIPALNFMRKVYYGEEEYNHIDVDMHVRKGTLHVEIRNIDDACYMVFDISFEEE